MRTIDLKVCRWISARSHGRGYGTVESRRKRRPDFLIRVLERDTEDALGDLCFEVEVLDIALDE
jgi:hypothetical protein